MKLLQVRFFLHNLLSVSFFLSLLGIKSSNSSSMCQVAGLPNNSYKLITNTAWVCARLCKLQKKGYTRLASHRVYQLLAHGRWFSPGTPASSITKTGRHDIADILLKVALNTNIKNQNQIHHRSKLLARITRIRCGLLYFISTRLASPLNNFGCRLFVVKLDKTR